MSKILWQALKAAPAVLIASLVVGKTTLAAETQTKIAAEVNLNKNLIAQNNDQILEQIDRYNQEAREQGQIVNVFQLRDVSPGDWAFEALRSLVERYGCIVGYPDRTYRGNRALTRYEFAAGLNACLNQIERLIAASEAVLREDIDRLQRLIEEFEAELAALGVRVDDLEGRVAFLEDHQFSTTTKLVGETIIGLSVAGGGDKANEGNLFAINSPGQALPDRAPQRATIDVARGEPSAPFQIDEGETVDLSTRSGRGDVLGRFQNIQDAVGVANTLLPQATPPGVVGSAGIGLGVIPPLDNVIFALDDPIDDQPVVYQRTRLNLNTSFTGRDRLLTRLESGNVPNFRDATGSPAARLGFDKNNDNNVDIGKLWYRVNIGDNFTFHIGAADVDFDDISDAKNPFFESSGSGALSRFGRRNPAIFRNGADRSLGANIRFNDFFGVDVAYLTNGGDDPDPEEERGLFNGDYTAAIQVNVTPSERFDFGIAYARSYTPATDRGDLRVGLGGGAGTVDADNPFAYYDIALPGVTSPFGFGPAAGNGVGGVAPVDLSTLTPYVFLKNVGTSANRFGLQGTAKFGERFNVNAWIGYVNGIAEEDPDIGNANALVDTLAGLAPGTTDNLNNPLAAVLDADFIQGTGTDIINGALGIAILDVGREGSVIGLIAGVPPVALDRGTRSGTNNRELDPNVTGRSDFDVPIFVEGQFRFPITKNILITPGIYAVIDPEQDSLNDTIFVGTIRTTFKF